MDKKKAKLGRTASHRNALYANQLKSLIEHGQIATSTPIAKELRRHADRLITIAKKPNKLAAMRHVIARLRVRRNRLTPKEARVAKKTGSTQAYNSDRLIIKTLFEDLAKRFENREGGYTRLVRVGHSRGDGAERCIIQFLSE